MQNQVAVLIWAASQGGSLLICTRHQVTAAREWLAGRGWAIPCGRELCYQHSGSAEVSDCEYRSFFYLCPTVMFLMRL